MKRVYEVVRYVAYYRGWCQAFGEHDSVSGGDAGISWLFNERQVGFVLPPQLIRPLYREVLRRDDTPLLELSRKHARLGTFQYPLSQATDEQGVAEIITILENTGGVCLFMTSHFMYGTGARIITLSNNKPLAIIYKEIGPMHVRLG